MRRHFIYLTILCFICMSTNAQIGINTSQPKSTLDINKNANLANTVAQGLTLPQFTTAERSAFVNVEIGNMLYNSDKKCIEMYKGLISNTETWECLVSHPAGQMLAVESNGFEGDYYIGVALTASNITKFKFINNTFNSIVGSDLTSAVTVENGVGTTNATITTSDCNWKLTSDPNFTNGCTSVNINPGSSIDITYRLNGTLVDAPVNAKFDKFGVSATQTINPTNPPLGNADIQNKIVYVGSFNHNNNSYQGVIDNGSNQLTIQLPYNNNNGVGRFDAITINSVANEGQTSNDQNSMSLNIPSGIFLTKGMLTATINVGDDGSYAVKQLDENEEYTINSFNVDINGNSFNVILKGMGGILDKKFGDSTHDFLYLPVEVVGNYLVNGQPYKKTWLNMNLGAAYAKVGSTDFDLNVNKFGDAVHNDANTYGSTFQWQRKADGHEMRTSPTTNNLAQSWTESSADWDAKMILPTASSSTIQGQNWVSISYSGFIGEVNLWKKNGNNNPCPSGYHIPTQQEWRDFQLAVIGTSNSSNSLAIFNQNNLPNFSAAGYRFSYDASLYGAVTDGNYWSSDSYADKYAYSMRFNSYYTSVSGYGRTSGFSGRCVKDE